MRIIEFYKSEAREHWAEEIEKCDWRAAKFLSELLKKGEHKKLFGESAKIIILAEEGELISFCTLTDQDEIDAPEMKPWIGFVFTSPKYRGKRCAGQVLDYACKTAEFCGYESVYLSTDKVGLYEKYGFEHIGDMDDIHGDPSRVYRKMLK